MTGEIITTLGEVFSIRSVIKKLTACKKNHITSVILPMSNRKNVTKLPEEFKRGFSIFYVKDIYQVYKIYLDTDEQTLTNWTALYDIRRDHSLKIEKYDDYTLSKQILIDQIQVLVTTGKHSFIEDFLA